MDKKETKEQQLRDDVAEYPHKCEACGRMIELFEEEFEVLGDWPICKECKEDVNNHLK